MKILFLFTALLALTACNTTTEVVQNTQPSFARINADCVDLQLSRIQNASNTTSDSSSSYIAIAQNAEACLGDMQFVAGHPDMHLAMQLQAIAVMNYLKGSDVSSAKLAFSNFRQMFPMQDLVYQDYTSFVDTGIALLESDSLTQVDLMRLNINPSLKKELTRKNQWAMR